MSESEDEIGEAAKEIQGWWEAVRSEAANYYAPGEMLRLPEAGISLTALHCNIQQVYVRAIFPLLYEKVVSVLRGKKWRLCHLCGNSGVGKSAFLWYFIIRAGIEDQSAAIIYESGSYVWEFRGPRLVVVPKAEFNIRKISVKSVQFHLIDQRADYSRPLGARVLVAASPDVSNVKDAKKLRVPFTLYMPVWNKEEYFALVDSWKKREGDEELAARVVLAEVAFKWFGGIPRFLLDSDPNTLSEEHFVAEIYSSLSRTKLKNVQAVLEQGTNCPDVSWRLFHFKLQGDSLVKFQYTFCSDKVAGLYSEYLCRRSHDKIKSFLEAARPFPEFGALRGFVFEQYVIGQALHHPLMALPLVDDVYCRLCEKDDIARKRKGDWIRCEQCRGWCHVDCAQNGNACFQCKDCQGPPKTESVSDGNLLLRYYDGDLEDALLAAGEDAIKYLWRPLSKTNAVFDFVVLPYTLAQVTVSKFHPPPLKALVNGLKALRAWRQEFGLYPKRDDMLLFLVPPDIFENFQFQPYRGANRKVSQFSVQGIVQCKVAIPVNGSPYVRFDLGSSATAPTVPLDLDASLEALETSLNCVESKELVEEEMVERSLEEERNVMRKQNRVSETNDLKGLDFGSMKRPRLQSLCKQHKIRANTTNEEMVKNLSELQQLG